MLGKNLLFMNKKKQKNFVNLILGSPRSTEWIFLSIE